MKKLVVTIVCSCLFAGAFAQKDLTSAQRSFQTSIMNFLREEGYNPSLDEDKRISFKSEGERHLIIISSESPFFVVFNRAGYTLEGDDGLTRISALLACNDVNLTMNAVKLYCTEKSVIFNIEQYTRSAEDFKYVFYKNLKILAEAEKEFLKKYNEWEKE
jgi:hypothetical protein